MRFAFALVLLLVAPLAAAQTDTTTVAPPAAEAAPVPTASRKDVTLGHVLGYLVPGGGHYYAGETGTGALLTATFVTGYGLIVASVFSFEIDCSYESCDSTPGSATAAIAGGAMVLGAGIYSVVDGGRAVRRTNRRNGYAAATPRTTVVPHGAGLAMRVRL